MGATRVFDGVRAASESTIEIDFYYHGKRCRERIKLQPTPANLKRAAQHRAAIMAAIEKGEFDYAVTFPGSKNAPKFAKRPGDVLTVSAYLDGWLVRQEKQVKASTWDDYRKTLNGQIIPAFGALALSALSRADLRKWCAGLTCSNKRIANILSPLRIALAEAVEDELIDVNPLAGWTYSNAEAPKPEDDVDPFNADEQVAILNALDGQAKNFVQFAFWTGLRTSELVALNWSDIDYRAGIVRVRKATTQAARRRSTRTGVTEIEGTKTASGRRDVKLLGPALSALRAQEPFTRLGDAEVWRNPRTGERWEGDQPIRKTMWTPALRRARVRYRRPYQTRHTYASMLLSAGEHPMWVAQQMGHADWGEIRRVYGRFINDADPLAGSRAEAIFSPENTDQKADQTTQKHPIKKTAR